MLGDASLQDLERSFAVRSVVVDDVLRGLFETQLSQLRRDRHTARDITFAQLEKIDRVALLGAVRALLVSAGVSTIANPPDAAAFAKSTRH